MRPPHPLLMRTALTIQAQYAAHASRPSLFELPHTAWQQCVQAARLLEYARRRHWSAPAEELAFRVRTACGATARELERIGALLKPRELSRVPPLRELYSELVAVYDEHDEVRIDRKSGVVAVTTEPIELEGIDLGPFEIAVRCSALPDARCYSVVALQPNPSSCDSYVHPHIQNDLLCEGDGRLAIQRALADGRLCDFFEIVIRVIETYNPESAYLRMEDWHGVNCSSCGDSASVDDSYTCARCGGSLCFDCYQRCTSCDETYCSGCVSSCPDCEDVYCQSCLKTCSLCEGETCDKCRDEDKRCRGCSTAEADEEPAAPVDAAGSAGTVETAAAVAASAPQAKPLGDATAAVLASGLGQATVLA